MEQPSPGRRRARDGSVTVAHIVDRQPSTVRQALHRLGVERVAAENAADGSGPDEGRTGLRKVTGIALFTACAVALCAAVTAAAMITGGRTGQFAQQGGVNVGPVDGEIDPVTALRPDLLRRPGLPREPTTRPTDPGAAVADRPVSPDGPAVTPTAVPPVTTTTAGPTGAVPSTAASPAVRVVQDFFTLLHIEPDDALGLLEPRLLGNDASGFLTAWKSVRYVSVQKTEARPGGRVFAAVILHQGNGRKTYMEQLLTVSQTHPRRITDVRLISAQAI